MKTSISRFLLLSAALTTLALNSACSQQSSSAQSQKAAPPVANAPVIPPAPAAPAAVVESPVVDSTPATIPSNILPTSPLAQVVRLTQAGVDQSIIMVYVTNSSRTFNLDSDKIIYLTDLGIPTDAITAMMQRDQFLQQQFAAAQAEQQAQQVQQPQPAQTAPPAEAAPADTAEVVTQPAPVTANYFDDTLSPYGSWVVVNGYGRCWRPTACVYDPNWQPYCDRGHWVYTDCGWYWSSSYAWGSTFHYGRWFRDASIGWCWYPDTVWAPSWVTWRYSNNYCGWAPLPPRTYCQAGVGIAFQGSGVSVGFNFGLGASCFTFVPTQYFCNPHPRNFCANPSQATQIFNNTTVINNIRIHGSGNNQIIINNGIPVQNVVNTTQTPIRPVPVHQIDPAFAHSGADRVPGAHQANFTGNANAPMRPVHVASSSSTPEQNFSRPVALSGNDNNRPARFDDPAQHRSTQPVNNQNQQAGQGQSSRAPIFSQPERSRPVATAPQWQAAPASYHSPAYTAPVQTPSANFNSSPQTALTRWQQTGIPHNYNTRNPDSRQNFAAQNQVVAPPVQYSAPPQPQPQSRIYYSQPRNEGRQNYSPSPAVSAPQPQRSAPSIASAPAPQPQQQSQGGGRMGNQNWGQH